MIEPLSGHSDRRLNAGSKPRRRPPIEIKQLGQNSDKPPSGLCEKTDMGIRLRCDASPHSHSRASYSLQTSKVLRLAHVWRT